MSLLEISTEGALGVITLNRPEAINALNREMIDGISAALAHWQADGSVGVVLFEGRGARGFCSGGDVRAARQMILDGKPDEADAYFAAEYAMNLLIATYPKPVVALGHGAVMGGGIGVLGHADYRFATVEARFAMPEAAIGFVSDIGVNAILAQVTAPRALAFLMSGLAVGMGDALALGLCDAAIAAARQDAVRAGIVAASRDSDPGSALVRLMEAESIEPVAASLCGLADELAAEFAATTAAEIVAAIAARANDDERFASFAATLAGRSPSSLEAIVQSHRAARSRPEIDAVLGLDLALAGLMARRPDFAEGVRAVLVDKDQRPKWQPGAVGESDRSAIAQVVAGALPL